MIEVHLMRGESASTVCARNSAHLAEQLQRPLLPDPHSLVLELPVSSVVGDVCGALIGPAAHATRIERLIDSLYSMAAGGELGPAADADLQEDVGQVALDRLH